MNEFFLGLVPEEPCKRKVLTSKILSDTYPKLDDAGKISLDLNITKCYNVSYYKLLSLLKEDENESIHK